MNFEQKFLFFNYFYFCRVKDIWAAPRESVHSSICTQWKFWPAYSSVVSGEHWRFARWRSFDAYKPNMYNECLCTCAGWHEPSLIAYVVKHVLFSWRGSYAPRSIIFYVVPRKKLPIHSVVLATFSGLLELWHHAFWMKIRFTLEGAGKFCTVSECPAHRLYNFLDILCWSKGSDFRVWWLDESYSE